MRSRYKVLGLAGALSAFQIWSPPSVIAQEATPAEAAPAAEATPPAAAAGPKARAQQTEEIVVTGSRIRRMDLSTPAPVTVVTKDQITASGKMSIGDFLQSLPDQANAINTNANNGGDGATRIALRGLGSNRTLVLLNGRRFVPGGTGADSSVDLNSIPSAAIDRIEVLKDGASAVYGSDAIAGVVNLITKKGWTGSELTAMAGVSQRGDGNIYDVTATTGARADKGGFVITAGYNKTLSTMAGDRDWSKSTEGLFLDTIDGPYNGGSGTIPQGRIVLSAGQRGQQVAGASDLYNSLMASCTNPVRSACPGAYIRDPSTALGWRAYSGANDPYNYAPANYLSTPQQRIQLFATGDYKMGETSRLFFEGSYTNRYSRQKLAAEPLITASEGIVTSAQNIYNPFGVDVADTRRRLLEFSNRSYTQSLDTFRVVGGFDGTLSSDFGPLSGYAWDLSLNYGRNSGTEVKQGNLYRPNLANALGPSFVDATGPRCGTPDAPIDGCVPLNLFGGPGTIDQSMVNYLTFTGVRRALNSLLGVQANTSGELFTLGADRPAGIALGYEFRQQAGASIYDPVTAMGNTTGNKGENTSGSYNVHEGYVELSLPLVSGIFLAEDVEASAAARVFNYTNFGTDFTYKFGGHWKIIPDVMLRGTYSTAFRAPAIGDLYSGQADSFPSVKDPCRGADAPASCGDAADNGDDQSQLRERVGGNPELKPETAKIFTVGAVFTPSLIEGLSLTVDYYNIKMSDTITVLGSNVILASCYPSSGSIAPKYCEFIERDSVTHRITNIIDLNTNVGSDSTGGIDVSLRYALPTSVGRFGLTFDLNWLAFHDVTLADGTVIKGKGNYDLNAQYSAGGAGGVNPAIRFNTGLSYSNSGFFAGLNMRYVGNIKECGDMYKNDDGVWSADYSGAGLCYVSEERKAAKEVPTVISRNVGAYTIFDLALSYALDTGMGKTTIGVGVNNLFDVEPRKIYNGFTEGTDAYAYDFLGRYMYARVSHAF